MQCFKTYKSNIQKRIDPYFYSPEHNINLGSYNILTFADICNVITDGDHGNPQYAENCDGIPYLRVVDVKNNLINYKSMQYITKEYSEHLYKSCFAHENNLLISIVGTLGESVLYKGSTPLAISRGFAILEFNEKVIPEYVLAYTKTSIFNKQIQKNKVGSVQDGIYLQSLKEIKIPIPSLDEQQKIAQLALNAYENKLKREEDVEGIMSSLENEIFEYLDIKNINTKSKKVFSIRSNKLGNCRIDPLFYSQDILSSIESSKYKSYKLGEIVDYLKTGFAAGKSEQSDSKVGIIQIRPTNINDDRLLCFDKNIYINPDNVKLKEQNLLQKGEVLFNNTNSQELVGKTAFFNIEGEFFCSNHITRIGVKREVVNPIFLTYILNLLQKNNVFYNTCTNWNNQSGVNIELLKTYNIPLPDIKLQNQIAEVIKEAFSNKLNKELNIINEFNKIKAEVEKMILGEK